MQKLVLINLIFILMTNTSYAYLGPGIGGGIIAATIGLVVAILIGLIGLIWFPLKKLFKKRKKNKNIEKREVD